MTWIPNYKDFQDTGDCTRCQEFSGFLNVLGVCIECDRKEGKKVITSPNGGRRHSIGVRWDLIPYEGLEEVSRILCEGRGVHGLDNWKKTDFEDSEQSPINHGLRHFSKATTYPSGSPERIRQLAKAATNALFQLWYEVNLQKRNGESV